MITVSQNIPAPLRPLIESMLRHRLEHPELYAHLEPQAIDESLTQSQPTEPEIEVTA